MFRRNPMNLVSSPNCYGILSFSGAQCFDVSCCPYEWRKHQTKKLVVLFFLARSLNLVYFISETKNKFQNFPTFTLLFNLKSCLSTLASKDHMRSKNF